MPVASFFELMTGEFETLGLVDFPGFSGTFEFKYSTPFRSSLRVRRKHAVI